MIKTTHVEVYQKELLCDDCESEMQISDNLLTTFPPKYMYTCTKCGDITVTPELFPSLLYLPKDEVKSCIWKRVTTFVKGIKWRLN